MPHPRFGVPRLAAVALVAATPVVFVACDDARHAQRVIHDVHVPRIQAIVREDLERAERGAREAARRLGPGFSVADPERRAREMRQALVLLREPPRGIPELMISPLSFIAVAGADGIVLCRDHEPDRMAGQNAGGMFPHVRRAIDEGVATRALVEWPSLDPNEPPSVLMLHAAPIHHEGAVAGAVLVGTPLWRTAQRITRQLQAEAANEPGTILWVYLYQGERLHHHGTPADLDAAVPNAAQRAAGLARSPGGYTGQIVQYGRWYAYGVVPLPELGPDVGFVVWRSDPG